MTTERFTVKSADGVEISVQKAGAGPALLLVHGSLLNGLLSWGAVLPKFAEHFTVYAMDRRGRAPSGDAQQYSIQNEADDIAAVVERHRRVGGCAFAFLWCTGCAGSFRSVESGVALDPL